MSQLTLIANRTLAVSIEEYQRIQLLVQNRASTDVTLFQKTIQNLSHEISTIASNSNAFSLANYKAYMDLWINYRTELMKLFYQVLNDVFTVITVEIPKSLNRICSASRKQGLALI